MPQRRGVVAADAVDRRHRAEHRGGEARASARPGRAPVQAGGEHVSDSAAASSMRSAFSASYSLECLTSTRSPSNVAVDELAVHDDGLALLEDAPGLALVAHRHASRR